MQKIINSNIIIITYQVTEVTQERLDQRATWDQQAHRERGGREALLVEKVTQVMKGSKVAKETMERRDRKDLLEEKVLLVWMDSRESDRNYKFFDSAPSPDPLTAFSDIPLLSLAYNTENLRHGDEAGFD